MTDKRPLCNYDGQVKELAVGDNIPLNHNSLSGLNEGDYLHLSVTQINDFADYANLPGRIGGQLLVGGRLSSDQLLLQSTTGAGVLTDPGILFLVGNNGLKTAMTILNDGNVGIGNATPQMPLEVTGGILAQSTGSVNVNSKSTDNTTGSLAGLLASSNSGGNILQCLSHAPARTISRWGLTALGGWIEILSSGADNLGMVIGTNAAFPLVFGTNNAERMRIISNGYIGMGTASPGAKLELYGSGYFASGIRINDIANSNTETWDIGCRAVSSTVNYFSIENSADGNVFTIRDARVGIMTTNPTSDLSFGGNAARIIAMERYTTSNTAGADLTIKAGGATLGATDKAGGQLTLIPGTSTGTGESGVTVQGCLAAVSTGTGDGTFQDMIKVLGNKLGFFNVTPVVKPTAYTQTYATAAKIVPAATASNPPAGGTGTAAGGYDTAANRNLMITALTNNIADVLALKKVVNSIIDDLQALGIVG